MLSRLLYAAAFAAVSSSSWAAGALENPQPNAIESGITAISGWYCPAAAITIQIDNAAPVSVPYGSERADAATACNGQLKTGFSYLFNWNTLPVGPHTLKAFADGVPFALVTVNVVSLGSEFLTGKAGEYWLVNFPDYGKRARVTWQQSKQNFVISSSDTQVAPVEGTYIGSITTHNTGCTTPANNGGPRYDLYSYTVTFGANALLKIRADNSGTCEFVGQAFYTANGGHIIVPNGDFACSNGLKGTWASDRLVFDPSAVVGDVTLKYTAGETCTAVGRIGAARYQ
jgi:hypothetical protein